MNLTTITENQKIAIVYDHLLTPIGGAETVLKALLSIIPNADLITSMYDHSQYRLNKKPSQVTFLDYLPSWLKNHRLLAPIIPLAFETLNLSEYPIIISVSANYALNLITKNDQTHICYLLSPPRYLFQHREIYHKNEKLLSFKPIQVILSPLITYLKAHSLTTAWKPDYLIAISKKVDKLAQKYWKRGAQKVLYPPMIINTKNETKPIATVLQHKKNYLLVVSRLVHYKKIDRAIEVAQAVKKPLVIVGEGPELQKLKMLASQSSSPVIFLFNLSTAELNWIYKEALCLLMFGEEDFGIVALEANYWQIPVVINKNSGASEVILDSTHGFHLHSNDVQDMIVIVKKCLSHSFDKKKLILNAQKYSYNYFKKNIKSVIEQLIKNKRNLNVKY